MNLESISLGLRITQTNNQWKLFPYSELAYLQTQNLVPGASM